MQIKEITTKGLVRLGIFLVASLIGLVGVAAQFLGYGDAATTLGGIAAFLLPVVGGTASYNIEKAPDQKRPKPEPKPKPVKNGSLLDKLRETVAENRG